MSDIQNIIIKYLNSAYETVEWKGNGAGIFLLRSRIDNRLYICKIKEYYNYNVYAALKKNKPDGIPEIYELIKDDEKLYIIEQYIESENIYQKLSDEKSICEMAVRILDILDEIQGFTPPIIHRDIKPDNILISPDGIYLVDFNISREYRGMNGKDTFIMGTEGYAAPEQFGFSESDVRTDIYGMGATLRTLKERAGIESEKLDRIIKKATMIDPDNRYQSVQEMKSALKSRTGHSGTNKLKKYLLPGFRRGNIFFMLIATAFYILFGWICATINLENVPYTGIAGKMYIWLSRLFLMLATLYAVFFTTDYLGIQKKTLEILRMDKLKWFLKIPAVILIDLVGVTMLFVILVVLVIILGV